LDNGRWFESFVHVTIIEIEKSVVLLEDRGAHNGLPPHCVFFGRKVLEGTNLLQHVELCKHPLVHT